MRVVTSAVAALCMSAATAWAGGFDDACAYFRARADSGAGNTVFRQHISRECQAALAAFDAAPQGSESRYRAGEVLEAMQGLRTVLEDIPLARLAETYPPEILRSLPPLLQRPVSASGEVLIARVMGLTPRLSEWESWRLSQR